ncbi:MAG: hypothetical protein RI897_807 [Verrucomicrobiota bacterium]
MFIEFAADFHDLAGGFGATGEEAAAHDTLGESEGLDDIAGFGDAAVGEDGDAFLFGGATGDEEGGHLRDADTCYGAGGADGAGALSDLDNLGAGVGEEFDAGGGGDITCDDGEVREGLVE